MSIYNTETMNMKSEKSIKEYLKSLNDDIIIKYYLDIEYSPFPVLLIEEYTRRFKRKTKSQIIKDLKFQAHLAKKKTNKLSKMAKKHKIISDLTIKKSEEIIKQAKKKGYTLSGKIAKKSSSIGSILKKNTKSGIQSGINAGQTLKTSKQSKLELIEKLAELQKADIITKKEFQEKKKKILSQI